MVTIHNDVFVKFLDAAAGDLSVVQAARVSVIADESVSWEWSARDTGLINYLMKNRHGTPFEHNYFKFYVKAHIAVFREFHRHRIGISYNEMSGRYTEMMPEFYVASEKRPLVQTGSAGHYTYEQGTREQWKEMVKDQIEAFEFCWVKYQKQLANGVCKEIARNVLPLGMYSQMYVSLNARSMMSFLSLRTKDEDSMFPSYPMHEIELVARQMEDAFAATMPVTYKAFCKNGRVAP